VPLRWDEALYYALGLFTFQQNQFGYPRTAWLRALYFLAPVVPASALIGAFWRLLEERGSMLIGRARGHVVVGGLGNLGATIAQHFVGQRAFVVGVERSDDTEGALSLRAGGGGVVLRGDLRSAPVLRRARCHRAAAVFLASPEDAVNLDAAFHVRRLARLDGGGRGGPTVYAHVYDAALGQALAEHLEAAHEQVRVVPFNSYRFAAKALVAQLVRDRLIGAQWLAPGLRLARTAWPEDPLAPPPLPEPRRPADALDEDRARLDRAFRLDGPDGGAPDRLVIVGAGRFGRSVAHELLATVGEGARFLIVDRSDEHLRAALDSLPADIRPRVEGHAADSVSPSTIARIGEFAPTAVLVCTDNDLANLRLAIDLHRRSLRTVTRMFHLEASIELGLGLKERGLYTVGLSRLLRAAIPILTQERRLLAVVDLDFARTPELDHLFYLARVTDEDRRRLGRACVALDELPRNERAPALRPPSELALVWHRALPDLRELL
jgi:Trk K+ transport system NAD-binding subunit